MYIDKKKLIISTFKTIIIDNIKKKINYSKTILRQFDSSVNFVFNNNPKLKIFSNNNVNLVNILS